VGSLQGHRQPAQRLEWRRPLRGDIVIHDANSARCGGGGERAVAVLDFFARPFILIEQTVK
jgi:hypothetical protein